MRQTVDMTVVCLRAKPWEWIDGGDGAPTGPANGEECHVIEVVSRMTANPFVDALLYRLAGYDAGLLYSAVHFTDPVPSNVAAG